MKHCATKHECAPARLALRVAWRTQREVGAPPMPRVATACSKSRCDRKVPAGCQVVYNSHETRVVAMLACMRHSASLPNKSRGPFQRSSTIRGMRTIQIPASRPLRTCASSTSCDEVLK